VLLDDGLRAKVSDFGIAKRSGNPSSAGPGAQKLSDTHTTGVGTTRYMAPERLRSDEYSFPCDVYSFGMLLWELTHDTVVFQDYNGVRLTRHLPARVQRGVRPPLALPPDLTAIGPLITACWAADPADRPTMPACADELLKIESSNTSGSLPATYSTSSKSTSSNSTSSNTANVAVGAMPPPPGGPS
jgi:serine/threonine protein kinase